MSRKWNFKKSSLSNGLFDNREIETAMSKLRAKCEKSVEAAKVALKQGADIVVDEAKNRVPVKTGKLKASIKSTPELEGAVYVISAYATNKKGVDYAHFVEFGVNGRPFFYPAIDARRDEINEMVKTAMKNALI